MSRVAIIKASESKTVQPIWDAYRADREKDGKLMVNFDNDWKPLKTRFGNLEVNAITADVCRDYARARHDAGKSASTIWTELTRLRSCLNWAQKRSVIVRSPYIWVPTKPEGRTRVMSEAEVRKLLDACKVPHIKLFVILAITTAGRSAAICGLTWDKIDFEAGTIDLRSSEIINPLTKRSQKGRAFVPMAAEARAALQDANAGALTDYVIEWDGEPVKKVRKAFNAAASAAKLDGVTPHTLRRTAATWLEEGDVDMGRISRLLGHRDRRTTEKIYSRPRPSHLQGAADIIDMKIRAKKS